MIFSINLKVERKMESRLAVSNLPEKFLALADSIKAVQVTLEDVTKFFGISQNNKRTARLNFVEFPEVMRTT